MTAKKQNTKMKKRNDNAFGLAKMMVTKGSTMRATSSVVSSSVLVGVAAAAVAVVVVVFEATVKISSMIACDGEYSFFSRMLESRVDRC